MYSTVVVQEVLQTRRAPWDEEHSGWPWEVDNNQLIESHHQSWSSYNYMRSCRRTYLTWTILWSLSIWSKLERWKSLVSGYLMSWPKIVVLKCCLLLFYTTTNHFSIGLWHATNSGFYTIGDDQLSGCTEQILQNQSHFPKSNLHQKLVMVSVR